MNKFKKCAAIFFLFFLFQEPVEAVRTMKIVPIKQSTTHGGSIGGTGCVSADMYGVIPDGAVTHSVHTFTIVLTNLHPSLAQTVKLKIKAGSSIKGVHSDGGANAIPVTVSSNPVLAADWTSPDIVIPGGGSLNGNIDTRCNDSTCGAFWSPNNGTAGSAIFGTMPATLPGPPVTCVGTGQICLLQESNLTMSLEVSEDRGGLQGHIFSSAHRCNGWKDHYMMPPPSIAINGGRPF